MGAVFLVSNSAILENTKTYRMPLPQCIDCPQGQAQSAYGKDGCDFCDRGTIAAQLGTTRCSICEAGKFAKSAGLAVCAICGFGEASRAGQSACVQCTVGRYADTQGSQDCPPAPRSYADKNGTKSCTDCPGWQYQPFAGQSLQVPIVLRGILSMERSLTCRPCQIGAGEQYRNVCIVVLLDSISRIRALRTVYSGDVGRYSANKA